MTLTAKVGTAALVTLLVVLSGCATDAGNGTETTERTTSPTETTDPTHELPLSSDELVDQHESALRSAGSFTLVERTRISNPESGTERWINTTARADAETGELRSYQNWSATETEERTATGGARTVQTYVGPSGDGVLRQSHGSNGAVSYGRPPSDSNVTEYLRPNLARYVERANVSYEGVRTVAGTRTHVYAAPTLDSFEADSEGRIVGYDAEKLTGASLRLFVAENGLVKRFELRVSTTSESGPLEAHLRATYRDVGSTAVQRPAWLAEAKERVPTATRPNPAETVTEKVRDASLGATVTVTGPRYAVEDVELERQSGGIWDTGGDGYRKAQVSSLVLVRTPRDATPNEVAFSYDESAFSGEESGLAVFRYDRERQTFVRLETTVDEEANVARANVDGDGTYLVMHVETWRSLWE